MNGGARLMHSQSFLAEAFLGEETDGATYSASQGYPSGKGLDQALGIHVNRHAHVSR